MLADESSLHKSFTQGNPSNRIDSLPNGSNPHLMLHSHYAYSATIAIRARSVNVALHDTTQQFLAHIMSKRQMRVLFVGCAR